MKPGDYILVTDIKDIHVAHEVLEALRRQGFKSPSDTEYIEDGLRKARRLYCTDNGYEVLFDFAELRADFYQRRWRPSEVLNIKDQKTPIAHPAADILAEIAEEAKHNPEPWKAFEGTGSDGRSWMTPSSMGCLLRWVDNAAIEVRRRPRTIEIAGVEFPDPMREAPKEGDEYYYPRPSSPGSIGSFMWDGDKTDLQLLKFGFVHKKEDAARQHARALIIASGGDPDA